MLRAALALGDKQVMRPLQAPRRDQGSVKNLEENLKQKKKNITKQKRYEFYLNPLIK